MEEAEKALRASELESVVFFFGKAKDGKLLVSDILIPSDQDYDARSFGHVSVKPEFVAEKFSKLEKEGKTQLATVHSHPLNTLSSGDVDTHMKVIQIYPYQLSGVYNSGRFFFYRYEDGIKLTPYQVVDLRRFDRQVRAFGIEGQLLISSSTIAMIGVGGGNTKIAFDLASLGVGKLILIDPDKWEEHNRNRVFIPSNLCGRNKAESIKNLIEFNYDDVEVEAFPLRAEEVPDEVYKQADLLVVGPDTFSTRIFGNRLALRLKKPAVFPAAGIDSKEGKLSSMGGSVQVVVPGKTPCYECVNPVTQLDLDRETIDPVRKKRLAERYGLGDELEIPVAPAIASLNDVIAGMALWEIIKLITGVMPIVEYQSYDALECKIDVLHADVNPNCPACSPEKLHDKVETKSEEEVLSVERWKS
ncbi:MAG: ThiF family adenylyltransferase [Candidatus Brockarchaeota archaeon]|nr:ThiF family adenylyltransferase [Candidatus Brockarchaeota archaeon]